MLEIVKRESIRASTIHKALICKDHGVYLAMRLLTALCDTLCPSTELPQIVKVCGTYGVHVAGYLAPDKTMG